MNRTENSTSANTNFLGHQRSVVSYAFQTVTIILVATFNSLGNIAVFIAINRAPRLMRRASNAVVASLAVSDFLMLAELAFRLVLLYNIEAAERLCDVFSTLLVILMYVSILHLAVLSLDRYIAVIHPLRYQSIVITRRIKAVLAVIWSLPVLSMGIVPLVIGSTGSSAFRSSFIGCPVKWDKSHEGHQYHLQINVSLFVGLPFCFMLMAYGRIAVVSYYQTNRVQPEIQANEGNTASEEVRKRKKKKKDLKWAKTVGKYMLRLAKGKTGLLPQYGSFISRIFLSVIFPCHGKHFHIMDLEKTMKNGFSILFLQYFKNISILWKVHFFQCH